MKRVIFLALAIASVALGAMLSTVDVKAQCNGVFPNNTLCGNVSGSPAPPSVVPTTAITGSGLPGGATSQIQYNASVSAFGGTSQVTSQDGANLFLTAVASNPIISTSGLGVIFENTVNKVLAFKNDAGTISNTVIPSSAPTHQFMNSLGAGGSIFYAQPAFGDLTGTTSVITNSMLVGEAGNTLKGNTSNISATPTDVSVPSCSGASSALTWTLGTGFGCNNIASGGTPGGSTSQIQWNSNGAFAGISGSVVSPNASVALGGQTVTSSDPVMNITQTWNNGTSFTASKINVTDTSSLGVSSSGVGSLLQDWRVGNSVVLRLSKEGIFDAGGAIGGMALNSGNLYVGAYNNGWVGANASAFFGAGSFNGGSFLGVIIRDDGQLLFDSGLNLSAPDISLSRPAAKVMQFGDSGKNTNGWFNYAGQQRVTADASFTSTTTLGTVTGLSVALQAGRTYGFDVYLNVTDAPAAGIQTAISASGGLTATAVEYDGWVQDNNAIKGMGTATALGTVTASSITSNSSGIVVQIKGTITVNAAGTLNVQAAQTLSNVTATTIKRGSRMYVMDMP